MLNLIKRRLFYLSAKDINVALKKLDYFDPNRSIDINNKLIERTTDTFYEYFGIEQDYYDDDTQQDEDDTDQQSDDTNEIELDRAPSISRNIIDELDSSKKQEETPQINITKEELLIQDKKATEILKRQTAPIINEVNGQKTISELEHICSNNRLHKETCDEIRNIVNKGRGNRWENYDLDLYEIKNQVKIVERNTDVRYLVIAGIKIGCRPDGLIQQNDLCDVIIENKRTSKQKIDLTLYKYQIFAYLLCPTLPDTVVLNIVKETDSSVKNKTFHKNSDPAFLRKMKIELCDWKLDILDHLEETIKNDKNLSEYIDEILDCIEQLRKETLKMKNDLEHEPKDFEEMTISELKKICSERGLSKYKTKKKQELIDLLKK